MSYCNCTLEVIMKGFLFFYLASVLALVNANPKIQCPEEQEVDWEIEKLFEHEDCNKFYQCVHGQPVEMSCPPNLYFNVELGECDWPHNVDCNDRNVSEEEPDCIPSEPERPDIDFNEVGCPVDGSVHWLLPDETDCGKFYYCVHGSKVSRNCGGPLYFDYGRQICDWPQNVCCVRRQK